MQEGHRPSGKMRKDGNSPRMVIEPETLADLPTVPVVAVENHLDDKIRARYELHGRNKDQPSTCYAAALFSRSSFMPPSPRWVENFTLGGERLRGVPGGLPPTRCPLDLCRAMPQPRNSGNTHHRALGSGIPLLGDIQLLPSQWNENLATRH